MLRYGEAVLLSDDSRQQDLFRNHLALDIQSGLAIPIRLGQKVIGVLNIASYQKNNFQLSDQGFLQAIADQLALALENAKAYGQLQNKTQALTQSNAELARATQAKSDLLSWVNHELRSPLTAVLGFAKILKMNQEGSLSEQEFHYIDLIESSGEHMTRLVNDILDLAKIEAGKLDLRPESILLSEHLQNVVDMLNIRAQDKGITLKIKLADPSLWLVADPTRLKQIFLNLLTNAIKFTEANGKVTLQASQNSASDIEFSVTDTGIGIKTDDYAKIFGEFEQVDNSLTRSQVGTGLGLTLTKNLVRITPR